MTITLTVKEDIKSIDEAIKLLELLRHSVEDKEILELLRHSVEDKWESNKPLQQPRLEDPDSDSEEEKDCDFCGEDGKSCVSCDCGHCRKTDQYCENCESEFCDNCRVICKCKTIYCYGCQPHHCINCGNYLW